VAAGDARRPSHAASLRHQGGRASTTPGAPRRASLAAAGRAVRAVRHHATTRCHQGSRRAAWPWGAASPRSTRRSTSTTRAISAVGAWVPDGNKRVRRSGEGATGVGRAIARGGAPSVDVASGTTWSTSSHWAGSTTGRASTSTTTWPARARTSEPGGTGARSSHSASVKGSVHQAPSRSTSASPGSPRTSCRAGEGHTHSSAPSRSRRTTVPGDHAARIRTRASASPTSAGSTTKP
jgi:hypothetical protein